MKVELEFMVKVWVNDLMVVLTYYIALECSNG